MKETGIVKSFNGLTGSGYITDSKGHDIIIYTSSLNGSILTEGSKVEFEVRTGANGPEAFNVTVIS